MSTLTALRMENSVMLTYGVRLDFFAINEAFEMMILMVVFQ